MKVIYPVIISKDENEKYYDVYIPDIRINTEGSDVTDAIYMARDAIGLYCIECEDMRREIPAASSLNDVKAEAECDDCVVTLVDVDVTEYRRKNDLRTVRRNVTLPSWLDMEAKKAKINVSAVLQKALKAELHLL